MRTLDDMRRAASVLLRQRTGESLPEWRPAVDDDASDAASGRPNALAPVCGDPYHERTDSGLYACCPDPVVPVPPALVDYLVALLNADRAGGAA